MAQGFRAEDDFFNSRRGVDACKASQYKFLVSSELREYLSAS